MNFPKEQEHPSAPNGKPLSKAESIEQNPFEGFNLYGFFMSMEKEDKEDFATEIINKVRFSTSTFYNRLREQHPWTESEKVNIKSILVKYRKKYGV